MSGPGAEAEPLADPVAGTRIGDYEIMRRAGAGGMGVVFEARDVRLGRAVALKLVRAGSLSASAEERLLREARALAQLAHVNVVTVYGAGTFEDRPFIAMELVAGGTLKAWLGARRRSWREIVQIFADAARGLAAAHALGLVHRDFKPSNVLVGADGRARVADFGLVGRALDAPERVDASTATSDPGITETGAVMGTVAYMAPEQHLGRQLDARADQFSFCVALYEALHGQAPFAREGSPDVGSELVLTANVLGGRVRPTSGGRVPGWLHKLVLRGLALDPATRWPSMEAIVGRIERGLRRRWLAGGVAGVVLVATLGLATGTVLGHRDPGRACRGLASELGGVWDEARRADVRRALLASGAPSAEAKAQGAVRALDAYAASWVAARIDACEATAVRRTQSAETGSLRLACLEDRRRELASLARLLGAADRETALNAARAAGALGSVSACADPREVSLRFTPPADVEARASVAALRSELADIAALHGAGKPTQALERAQTAIQRAHAVAYRPLEAEIGLRLAGLHKDLRHPADVERALLDAIEAAEAAGHDRVLVAALGELEAVVERFGQRHDEAVAYGRMAHAVLVRLGGDPLLESDLLIGEAATLREKGQLKEALPLAERGVALREAATGQDLELARTLVELGTIESHLEDPRARATFQRALAIYESTVGDDHPEVAAILNNMAKLAYRQEGRAESLRMLRQALAIQERIYGPEWAGAASALHNIGMLEREEGNLEAALAAHQRALALLEKVYPPTHPVLAVVLTATAHVQILRGHAAEAAPLLERAITIREAAPPVDKTTLEIDHFLLAMARWELRQDRGTIRKAAEEAQRAYLAAGGNDPEVMTVMMGWLTKHR